MDEGEHPPPGVQVTQVFKNGSLRGQIQWALKCFVRGMTLKSFGLTILFAALSVVDIWRTKSAKDDVKGAGQDIKQAGKSTASAAKKTAKATKKTVKKGVNKAAEKTEEGANKVEQKTR